MTSRPPHAAQPLRFLMPGWFAAVMGLSGLALAWWGARHALGELAAGVSALLALVAALAFLAAATGFCAGCTAYRIGYRLTGRTFVSCPLPPQL